METISSAMIYSLDSLFCKQFILTCSSEGEVTVEPPGRVLYDEELCSFAFRCPQCGQPVCVEPKDVACRIFRHGRYKINHSQLNPHLPKNQCDDLFQKGLIYGCGKPFEFVVLKPAKQPEKIQYKVVKCAYK